MADVQSNFEPQPSIPQDNITKVIYTYSLVKHLTENPKAPLSRSGAEGIRTPDLLRAREALSQLSYGPVILYVARRLVWAFLDSNQRPSPYQRDALTS